MAQEPCPGKMTTATTVHILPAPCTIPGTVRGHSSKTGGAFVIVNNYCAFKTPGSEIDNKYQPGHFIWLDTLSGLISEIQMRLSFWQFNGSNTNDHPNNERTYTFRKSLLSKSNKVSQTQSLPFVQITMQWQSCGNGIRFLGLKYFYAIFCLASYKENEFSLSVI